MRTLKGHSSWVTSVAISSDGEFIVSGSYTVKVWRIRDGKLVRTIEGAYSPVAITPDGKFIVSEGDSYTIKVWRLRDGKLVRTLKDHLDWISSIAISPDGEFIVSGSGDRTIKVWRLRDGKLVRTLKGHSGSVNSVAISPDGEFIVSGSDDETIKVWRMRDGKLVRTLKGHSDGVTSVAISPDGEFIVSGSWDGMTQVWRMRDGLSVRTLKAHYGWVASVAISPEGEFIVSGGEDNTIKVWRMRDGELLATLAATPHGDWVAGAPNGLWDGKSRSGSWPGVLRFDGTLKACPGAPECDQFHYPGLLAYIWEYGEVPPARPTVAETTIVVSRPVRDTVPPRIVIFEPSNGRKSIGVESTQGLLGHITGRAYDESGIRSVKVNNYVIQFTPMGDSADFSTDVQLLYEGENRFEVAVEDSFGNRAVRTVRFYLSRMEPPIVRIVADTADGRAMVRIVVKPRSGGAGTIELTRNGERIFRTLGVAAAEDIGGGKYRFSVSTMLVEGTNRFVVSAWDSSEKSFASDSVTLIYRKPAVILPPFVNLTLERLPSSFDAELKITARATETGGIGRIELYRNGELCWSSRMNSRTIREKGIEVLGEKIDKKMMTYDVKVRLNCGVNSFEARAYDSTNTKYSPSNLTVNGPNCSLELYLFVVGINDYEHSDIPDLMFARADAEAFKDTILKIARPLYQKIHVIEFYDRDATTVNLTRGLERLAHADENATIIFYFSGHGILNRIDNKFYFVTADTDPMRLSETALSVDYFRQMLRSSRAKRVFVAIDACASGAAIQAGSQLAMRDVTEAEFQKVMVMLSEAAGGFMIASSRPEGLAGEGHKGHGFMTYSLLEALSGKADMPNPDGLIDVNEVVSYAVKRTPEIARAHAHTQYPYQSTEGINFVIGVVEH